MCCYLKCGLLTLALSGVRGGRMTMDTQDTMQRSETTVVVVVVVVSQTKLLYFYIMALLHPGCSNRDKEK